MDESHSDDVVDFILSLRPMPKTIVLEGDLGAGKTTLVKKLVKAMGSDNAVSSPSFSLVNEYLTRDGKKIYHSDWYRVKDIEELYDAGMEEYIFGEDLLIIEWPE